MPNSKNKRPHRTIRHLILICTNKIQEMIITFIIIIHFCRCFRWAWRSLRGCRRRCLRGSRCFTIIRGIISFVILRRWFWGGLWALTLISGSSLLWDSLNCSLSSRKCLWGLLPAYLILSIRPSSYSLYFIEWKFAGDDYWGLSLWMFFLVNYQ